MPYYLQQHIVKSKATFPVVVVWALLLWFFSIGQGDTSLAEGCSWTDVGAWPRWVMEGSSLLLMFATVYLFVEINNTCSIVGRRSILHVTFLIFFWGSNPFFSHNIGVNALVFLMALVVYLLFQTYQNTYAVLPCFMLFACLGVGSLLLPYVWCFVPLFILAIQVFRALTLRSFFAALVGLLFPYWLLFVYTFSTWQMSFFYEPFVVFGTSLSAGYGAIPRVAWVDLGAYLPVFVVSAVHFIRNDFQDKIRTRVFLYFLFFYVCCCLLLLLLRPQCYAIAISLMQIGCCILVSHFFSLVTNRVCNIFFMVWIVILLLVSICNIWMPSYNFF